MGPLVTFLFALAAAVQALRRWDWRPGLTLSLSGDAPGTLVQVREFMHGNWFGVDEATGAFRRSAAVLDAHLRDHDHVAGDDITVADFALASGLPYADETGVPFREFAHVARWYAQIDAIPAWRDPYPARPAAA